MKKIIQSVQVFCGREDNQKIVIGNQSLNSDDYNLALFGKLKTNSTQIDDSPILAFPIYNDVKDGTYEECFICGDYWFTFNDTTLRHIESLSTVFGRNMDRVTFAGYSVHDEHNIIGMVALGKDLYMANNNYDYIYIGNRDDYFPSTYVSMMFDGFTHIILDEEGNYSFIEIDYDDEMNPTFYERDTEVDMMSEIKTLKPTCLSVHRKNAFTRCIYVNNNGEYINLNKQVTPVIMEYGNFNLDSNKLRTKTGSIYNYMLNGSFSESFVALVNKEFQIQDSVESKIERTYNNKNQLSTITKYGSEWNNEMTGITNTYIKKTSYTYVWEDQSLPYKNIATNAVELLYSIKEEIFNSSGIQMTTNENYTSYMTINDKDSIERIIYKNSIIADGLEGEERIIINEAVKYTNAGQLDITGAVVPNDNGQKRLYSKIFYSDKKPDYLLASFDNVCVNNSNVCMAGYSGFEPFENYTLSNGSIITTHFNVEGATISNVSLKGTQSAYFPTGGKIKASSNLFLDSSYEKKYVLQLLLRSENNEQWEIITNYITPSSISADKTLYTVPAKTYVDMVLFRNIDCEAKIYLYDNLRRTGIVDNNFTFTFFIYDCFTGKNIASYKKDIIEENGKKYIGKQLILNQINCLGYASLGGFNGISTKQVEKTLYNTLYRFTFRKNAEYLVDTINIPSEIDSFVIMGQGKHSLTLKGTTNISIDLDMNECRLFQNNAAMISPLNYSKLLNHNFNWIIGIKYDVLFVIINGKLIFTTVLNTTSFTNVINNNISDFCVKQGKAIIAMDFDIQACYYDLLGRLIQTQTLKKMYSSLTRIVIEALFYNGTNQVVAKGLKSAFPPDKTTKLKTINEPLYFRRYHVRKIAWEGATETEPRGILTGELAEYYNTGEGKNVVLNTNDYKFPYYYYDYEIDGNHRIVKELQPGINGSKNLKEQLYHSDVILNTYAKEINPLEVNYNGIIDKINQISNNKNIRHFRLYDSFQNIFGEYIDCEDTSIDNISYKITHNIGTDKLSKDTTNSIKTIGDTYYQAQNPTSQMSWIGCSGMNRIHSTWTADGGYRILIYDAVGNGRLVLHDLNISNAYATYYKYDTRNRMIESGYVKFNNEITLSNLLAYTLNSSYPTNASIGISEFKRTVTYEYDLEGYGYSLGRLCRVTHENMQKVYEYHYDVLGRVIKQVLKEGTQISFEEFKRDNLFNLISVKYVRPNTTDVLVTYLYQDNQPTSITLSREGRFNIILNDAKYDIYNRLVKYVDCNNRTIENKYDLLGRQIYTGESESLTATYVKKIYTENGSSSQRLEAIKYYPDNTTKSLTYDNLLRLMSTSDGESNIKYDKNGNMIEYSKNGGVHQVTYALPSHIEEVEDKLYEYDPYGNIIKTTKGTESILNLTYDKEFISKVSSLEKTNIEGQELFEYVFQYDAYGRVLDYFYTIPQIGNAISYTNYYSEDGRILQMKAVTQNVTSYTTNIYLGNRLIAQELPDGKYVGFCYDDSKTLHVISTYNGINNVKYNSWGMPSNNVNAPYVYREMQLLNDLQLYLSDGSIYDPSLGITYSIIAGSGVMTPYRTNGNTPYI